MRQLQIRGMTLLLLFLGAQWSIAQQVYNSGSIETNDISGQNVIISASIGQVFSSVSTSNDITELQGVQQPLRFEVLSIEPVASDNGTITLYPNPATTHFKLNFTNWNSYYSYSLMNVSGKTLKNGKVLSNDAALDINELAAGIYMVAITNTTGFIKTFKIIKK